MDWKSRRVEATLEQALVEDRATNDVTTAMTIEPGLRASGTVLARQDCVISGLGCIPRFLEIFIRLDKKNLEPFRGHQPPRDVRRCPGQEGPGGGRDSEQCARHSGLRTRHSELDAADERHLHLHPGVCGCRSRHQGQGAGHAQDRSRPSRAGQIRGPLRRGREPSPRSFRRHSDQEQSHWAGGGIPKVLARAFAARTPGQTMHLRGAEPG
jgi:hypothetical protein